MQAVQVATEGRILVAHEDAGTGMCGCVRCSEPGRSAADHQHVAVRVLMLIAVRIRYGGTTAHSRGVPNKVFVAQPPARRRRPHERLVVEACRQQPRQYVVDRSDVEAKRRPAVLTGGDEALEQLLRRSAHIGFGARSPCELYQRIRLVTARAKDAARPVILEAAGDKMHAVGE